MGDYQTCEIRNIGSGTMYVVRDAGLADEWPARVSYVGYNQEEARRAFDLVTYGSYEELGPFGSSGIVRNKTPYKPRKRAKGNERRA